MRYVLLALLLCACATEAPKVSSPSQRLVIFDSACTGVLISPTEILTLATCVPSPIGNLLQVGERDGNSVDTPVTAKVIVSGIAKLTIADAFPEQVAVLRGEPLGPTDDVLVDCKDGTRARATGTPEECAPVMGSGVWDEQGYLVGITSAPHEWLPIDFDNIP